MGQIILHGLGTSIEVEDRALTHIVAVITVKLRRNESLTLTWDHPDESGHDHSTVWVHPSSPLRFEFDTPTPERLDLRWIDRLMRRLNRHGGISISAGHLNGGQ